MMWEGKGEYEILPHQETWKSALKEFHINLLCFLDFDCVIVSELHDFPPPLRPPTFSILNRLSILRGVLYYSWRYVSRD